MTSTRPDANGERRPRRVTAYSVAAESGVSQATVSYVLNNTPNQKISDETRRRVLEAAERLNYRPYEPARTLSSGRSSLVLFLIPDFPLGHTMSLLLDHMSTFLNRIGKTLLTYRVPQGAPVADVANIVSPWAVISIGPIAEDQRNALASRGVIVEIMGLQSPDSGLEGVLPNPQERVGRLQAEYLLRKGHSRIAYAYPDDPRLDPYAVPRLAGSREAIREWDGAELTLVTVHQRESEVREAMRRLVDGGTTAVCAYNDDVAFALLAAARMEGIAVPGQLAVVGVDDLPLAAISEPPLTTIAIDMRHLAARLVARIDPDHPYAPLPGIDETHVVVRASA